MYFHTRIAGPSVQAFRGVFGAAFLFARQYRINQVVLAVHAKGNLDNVISDAIGAGVVKKLQKAPTVMWGLKLGLTTQRISIPFQGDAVFIAAHVSTEYLEKLEASHKCKALFYVPWRDEELAEYLTRHESKEIKIEETAPPESET